MEHTASEYERRRLLIGPVSAQGLDEKMALVTRQIPSPDERNQEYWARTFFQVAKRDGIKAEIKTIISTDLSKFETRDYSGYFHPGRPTRKPRDIDERKIKKDLFELTIPMTGGEKQQVQQERGPKYYWQRARLIGANATVEADGDEQSSCCRLLQHQRPSAAGVNSGGHERFRQWRFHGRYIKHDIVENEPSSKGLETMLTLATETGRTATISTDANAFKSSLVYW
ncbi:hypothetical protein FOXYS1_11322 [Fusarium oxysporum]|uniref:Uncharacterized protein n=1 Tax=Fusarium oxysporum TaxID=5507 RepID=A0A8H5A5Q3_FUSOX|nr:hypothetical protein FOXYS1_11322 [Fusarium oxysporum]